MATIKNFTSLEQSRKLAEILPLESADMCYQVGEDLDGYLTKTIYTPLMHTPYNDDYIPCWSLTALLDFLPDNYIDFDDTIKHPSLIKTKDSRYMVIYSAIQYTSLYNNPVDACVAMIEKLNELKLL